jgi:hypothetical protein
MTKSWKFSRRGVLSRRAVLQGVGTALALPWLEAMAPILQPKAALGAEGRPGPANRMAFVYVPNGIHMADWTPALAGADFELPYILEPLKSLKDEVMVLTGLACDKARPHGDGAGDHARSLAAFLTGSQAKKTHGADIKVGVSVDQVAAQRIGERTKFASLELGCERGPQAGNCDSGYSCSYSANISWRSESTPNAKEIDPRLLFERLFSDGSSSEQQLHRARRETDRQSVLDFVLEDARDLSGRLGSKDKQKIDEYLTSVREIEGRIRRSREAAAEAVPAYAKPSGIPQDYAEHIRLMADLMVLAFQADLTRVTTLVLANEGSNRSYPFINVPEGHHDVSHHGRNADKQKKIREINRFHLEQFAYLLGKLKAVREGERTLLDNSMIVYGSGISDGDRHNHDDLPVLLAGRGAGTIQSGRHIRYNKETPISNLYLAMLDRIDAPTDKLGDSDGKLELG